MSDEEFQITEKRVLQTITDKKRRMSDISNEYEISLAREAMSSRAVSAACGQLCQAVEELQRKFA